MTVFKVCALLFCLSIAGCQLESTANDFFYVPWPSDTRLVDGGNVLSSGQEKGYEYPGAESSLTLDVYHLFANHVLYRQGARKMDRQKFGVNSAIFFTFEQVVASNSLPASPLATQERSSPVQLVNIDRLSDQFHKTVPLMLDFKGRGTKQRPENVLSILPYPGFTLTFDSRYAAIVFNDLKNGVGEPLEKKQLYQDIDHVWDKSMVLTESQHRQWQQDKLLVENYVASIGREMEDVVAYTVFSTQNPAKITLDLKDALHTLDDTDIQKMVVRDDPIEENNPEFTSGWCVSAGGVNNWVTLTAKVKLPRWQKGVFPYLLFGGKTEFKMENGKVAIPQKHEVVTMKIAVPCDATNAPNAYIVSQGGNSSTAGSSVGLATYALGNANEGAGDVLVIGVGDLISGYDRKDDSGVQKALSLVRTVTEAGGFGDSDILPAIRNGYFNPVAARGNMRQAAAEAYILKRVAENLVHIVEETFDIEYLEKRGLSLAHFSVDKDRRVGLTGFSQGANNSMVNMVMDEHYDFAYVGSGAGFDLPLVADKPGVKALLRVIFQDLEYGELDLFHPIGSFVQMAFEAMDSSNYVAYVNPTNLFVTAGSTDTNVPPLASEQLAIALARRGLMSATGGGQGKLLDVKSFADVLNQDPVMNFPISGNILSGQGTGIYSYGDHGHWQCGDVGGFLYSATRGGPAVLNYPCDSLY